MIKKKEIIIIAVMILISVAAVFIMRSSMGGSKILVTLDGQTYGEYSLRKNQEIEIVTDYGRNLLIIEDGKADMTEATCPDKICVDMNPISDESPGLIVCLPNKIVVELK